MGELDVDHFRRPQYGDIIEGVDEFSQTTSAPTKPSAISNGSNGNGSSDNDPNHRTELEGEILPPSLAPTTTTTAYQQPIKQLQPHQKIDFTKLESRQELLAELNAILPLNEYNLPRYFYRCDLLDFRHLAALQEASRAGSAGSALTPLDDYQGTAVTPPTTSQNPPQGRSDQNAADADAELQQQLESTIEHLDYFHGYPTLRQGLPFWAQLPFESIEAFGAFVNYLEQPGVRTFHNLNAYAPQMLTEWFHIYCWAYRARAYDMFKMTHHTRMRTKRIMETEDDHYIESQAIFRKIVKAFGSKTAEDLQSQEPKALIDMLEKITKLQRVSAGLPALGVQDPSKENTQPLSLEVQMRQIAQKDGPNRSEDDAFDTLALLQSPDALQTAQELIIKVNRK